MEIIDPKRDYVLSLCKVTTEWLEEWIEKCDYEINSHAPSVRF